MNILKKLSYGLMTCAALFAAAGCSDPDAEITELTLDRALRPTDVTVKVQDKVNAKISAYFVTVPETATYEFYTTTDGTNYTLERTDNPVIEADDQGKSHQTITYTAKKLSSETSYKLVLTSTYQGKTSGAVEVLFETDAEQILNDVTDDDITSTTVLLSWEPGETVTTITVSKSDEVLQTITLTAEQIAAGQCKITGLNPESKYTFAIFNGTKQRGKQVVTTLPNYTPIYAGVNVDIQSYIDAAEAGSTLMLLPAKDGSTSEFTFVSEEGTATVKDLTIDKDITISCLGTKPVVANMDFKCEPGASLKSENITYNCGGKNLVTLQSDGAYGTFTLNNLVINKPAIVLQLNAPTQGASSVQSIDIENCLITTVGAAIVRNDKFGVIDNLVFKQNTVSGGSTTRGFCIGNKSVKCLNNAEISNNTFNNLKSMTDGLLYIRSVSGGTDFSAKFYNNFCVNCEASSVISKDGQTNGVDYKNNFYLNCAGFMDSSKKAYDANGTEVTGNSFKDAANGDYTITNETVTDANAGNTNFTKR